MSAWRQPRVQRAPSYNCRWCEQLLLGQAAVSHTHIRTLPSDLQFTVASYSNPSAAARAPERTFQNEQLGPKRNYTDCTQLLLKWSGVDSWKIQAL